MARIVRISGKRVRLPVFVPTIFLDQKTRFWRYGFPQEALLVSYDVLAKNVTLLRHPLADSLGFEGLAMVDSGAYGRNDVLDPLIIYKAQQRVRADIAVTLDQIAYPSFTVSEQWKRVRTTVANASRVVRINRDKRLAIEGVIQGATPEQRLWCAIHLQELGLRVYGVPVSKFSQARQYDQSARRVLEIRHLLPAKSMIHGMGAGSRTTIAVLAYFGVEIFDSTSWFTRAIRGERFPPVTTCVLGETKVKPECTFCQSKHGPVHTNEDRVSHNLREILKEITRIRCAQEEDVMREYIETRVRPSALKKLKPLLRDYEADRPA